MPQEIDQQKAALQAAIAQQGSLGQQRFEAQQKAIQDTQQNAAKMAYGRLSGGNAPAPPPSMGASLGQQSQLISDTYATDSGRAAQAYGNEMNRLSTANANYFDQVNAAVPVIQARAQAEANRIQAELQAQERERQAEAEARQLQIQSQREAAALARDKQAFEKEQLDFERERFRSGRDAASRTGAIGNYTDTGHGLGYNDDLLNYMKGDKVNLKATGQNGEETSVAQNPYTFIMEAAQKAMEDPKATWQDVQRAITTAENTLSTGAANDYERHGWQNERRLVEEQLKPVFGQTAERPADAQQQIDTYEQGKKQAATEKAATEKAATEHATIIDRISNESRAGGANGWHLKNIDEDFDPLVHDVLMDTELVQTLTDGNTSPKSLYEIGGSAAIQRMLDRLGIKDPTARLNDEQRRALLVSVAGLKGRQAGGLVLPPDAFKR